MPGRSFCLTVVATGILLSIHHSAVAATINVPVDYATIQAAVEASSDGDEIIIAPGVYQGEGNRDISVGGKRITVTGVDPHNPAVVSSTIIDCQGTALDHHRGFSFVSGEEATSRLVGLTITHGYPAAINCVNSSPTISNCLIKNNATGIAAAGNAVVTACRITSNSDSGVVWHGGQPVLAGCVIAGNLAGGIVCNGAVMLVKNTLIHHNVSASGAGIHNNPLATGVVTLENCTLTQNSASSSGGGIYSQANGSSVTLVALNSIVWQNSPEQICAPVASSSITYSNIQGGWSGIGNIDIDPCFADAAHHDYHLKSQGGRWQPSIYTELDIADDAVLDVADLGTFLHAWLEEGILVAADLDHSGEVDLDDFTMFGTAYLKDYTPDDWGMDTVTSPCIDAGAMASNWVSEPAPNGACINMGAYGGTTVASKSLSDLTYECLNTPYEMFERHAPTTNWQPTELNNGWTVSCSDANVQLNSQAGRFDKGIRVVANHSTASTATAVWSFGESYAPSDFGYYYVSMDFKFNDYQPNDHARIKLAACNTAGADMGYCELIQEDGLAPRMQVRGGSYPSGYDLSELNPGTWYRLHMYINRKTTYSYSQVNARLGRISDGYYDPSIAEWRMDYFDGFVTSGVTRLAHYNDTWSKLSLTIEGDFNVDNLLISREVDHSLGPKITVEAFHNPETFEIYQETTDWQAVDLGQVGWSINTTAAGLSLGRDHGRTGSGAHIDADALGSSAAFANWYYDHQYSSDEEGYYYAGLEFKINAKRRDDYAQVAMTSKSSAGGTHGLVSIIWDGPSVDGSFIKGSGGNTSFAPGALALGTWYRLQMEINRQATPSSSRVRARIGVVADDTYNATTQRWEPVYGSWQGDEDMAVDTHDMAYLAFTLRGDIDIDNVILALEADTIAQPELRNPEDFEQYAGTNRWQPTESGDDWTVVSDDAHNARYKIDEKYGRHGRGLLIDADSYGGSQGWVNRHLAKNHAAGETGDYYISAEFKIASAKPDGDASFSIAARNTANNANLGLLRVVNSSGILSGLIEGASAKSFNVSELEMDTWYRLQLKVHRDANPTTGSAIYGRLGRVSNDYYDSTERRWKPAYFTGFQGAGAGMNQVTDDFGVFSIGAEGNVNVDNVIIHDDPDRIHQPRFSNPETFDSYGETLCWRPSRNETSWHTDPTAASLSLSRHHGIIKRGLNANATTSDNSKVDLAWHLPYTYDPENVGDYYTSLEFQINAKRTGDAAQVALSAKNSLGQTLGTVSVNWDGSSFGNSYVEGADGAGFDPGTLVLDKWYRLQLNLHRALPVTNSDVQARIGQVVDDAYDSAVGRYEPSYGPWQGNSVGMSAADTDIAYYVITVQGNVDIDNVVFGDDAQQIVQKPIVLTNTDEFPVMMMGLSSYTSDGVLDRTENIGCDVPQVYTLGAARNSDINICIANDLSFLDLAWEHGLYVAVNVGARELILNYPDGLARIEAYVAALHDHPAIGMWYLIDEPSHFKISASTLQPYYDIVKSYTPNIPCGAALNWTTNWSSYDYSNCIDISMPDNYPIKDPLFPHARLDLATTWAQYQFSYGAGYGYDNVMPILQCHSREYYGEPGRIPLPEELRYWAYSSLIMGCKGLSWYGYYYAERSIFPTQDLTAGRKWLDEEFGSIMNELQEFTSASCARPALDFHAFINGSNDYFLAFWEREGQGKSDWLVLVNGRDTERSNQTLDVSTKITNADLESWGPYTRDTPARVVNGNLNVKKILPWEVMIWRVKRGCDY